MLILEIIRLVREPLCDLRRGQFVILKAAVVLNLHMPVYSGCILELPPLPPSSRLKNIFHDSWYRLVILARSTFIQPGVTPNGGKDLAISHFPCQDTLAGPHKGELSIELFTLAGITVKCSHIFVSLSHLPEIDLPATQSGV